MKKVIMAKRYSVRLTEAEREQLQELVGKGTAVDQKIPVGVAGRFTSIGLYLIITVYEITD